MMRFTNLGTYHGKGALEALKSLKGKGGCYAWVAEGGRRGVLAS